MLFSRSLMCVSFFSCASLSSQWVAIIHTKKSIELTQIVLHAPLQKGVEPYKCFLRIARRDSRRFSGANIRIFSIPMPFFEKILLNLLKINELEWLFEWLIVLLFGYFVMRIPFFIVFQENWWRNAGLLNMLRASHFTASQEGKKCAPHCHALLPHLCPISHTIGKILASIWQAHGLARCLRDACLVLAKGFSSPMQGYACTEGTPMLRLWCKRRWWAWEGMEISKDVFRLVLHRCLLPWT